MANEITVTAKLECTNGNLQTTVRPNAQKFDQTAVGAYDAVHSIATAEENVTTFQDLTTEGWCYLRNLDATNYCQVGFSTGVYGIRLEAGESALFRCEPAVTLYLKSDTAACNVRIVVLEN